MSSMIDMYDASDFEFARKVLLNELCKMPNKNTPKAQKLDRAIRAVSAAKLEREVFETGLRNIEARRTREIVDYLNTIDVDADPELKHLKAELNSRLDKGIGG